MGMEPAFGGGNQEESPILCVNERDLPLVHGLIWIQANITALQSSEMALGLCVK